MTISLGVFIGLEDLWKFLRDEGVGVGHVAQMKIRATNRSFVAGQVLLQDLPHVIGDAELEVRFLSRMSSGKYVRVSQVGVCGDGE